MEDSPIYGATNHDIIDVCRRITKLSERLEQLAPLMINISARLEALEDSLEAHSKQPFKPQGVNNWNNEGGNIPDDKPRHTLD